jgi:hypothetical protein
MIGVPLKKILFQSGPIGAAAGDARTLANQDSAMKQELDALLGKLPKNGGT